MEVHVLGPLDLIDESGVQVAVKGKGLRTLLAVLAVRANEVVLADHLIDVLWRGTPPKDPRGALQILVSRLRKLVGDALTTRGSGYVLRLSPDDLDAAVFERLVGEGRRAVEAGLHGEAVNRFMEGLRLWKSGAVGELANTGAEEHVLAGWHELRRSAEDQLMESEMAQGRHREVVAELERLVEEEPFRERRWALLMLALYRSGRQVDALAAYKRLASVLGEGLGIEPASEVFDLEEQILLHDPRLRWEGEQGRHPSPMDSKPRTVTFVVALGDGPMGQGDWSIPELTAFEGGGDFRWAATPDTMTAVAEAARLAGLGWGVGVHVGNAVFDSGRYVGLSVHKAGRVAAAARTGQALLSSAVSQVLDGESPLGVVIKTLGEFRLPGVSAPEALFQAYLADTPPDFQPPLASPIGVTNLPHQIDTFVGRARELDEVGALVDDNRLLTLTGPGGIGKTRLALQVAADRVGRYDHGVWFVDLTAINASADVAEEIARVLDVPGFEGVEDLEAFLGDRRVLLVVDNCEHVIDEAADVVHRLLKSSLGLSVLATSRQRLGIPGEVGWTVPAMRAPTPAAVPIEDLLAADAVILFGERASARRGSFTVSPANVVIVAELCRRLDGIPLAIELAAARVVTLDPQEILDRLQDRSALLATRDRGVQPRHRTLRAVIEWSHDNLTSHEQVLFRRLAVFRGGFTIGQAEAVCTDEQLPASLVVDAVEALAEKSLLSVEATSNSRRFDMLTTILEFALTKLEEQGEMDSVAHRHACELLRLAQEAKDHLERSEGKEWFENLAREHENLVAAVAWSYGPGGDPAVGAETMSATASYWDLSGRWLEGIREARALLASERLEDGQRAEVELVAGILARFMGQFDQATSHSERALGLMETLADDAGAMRALNSLGNIASDIADFEHADVFYERAAATAMRINDSEFLGRILNSRGAVAQRRGDLDTASKLYGDALAAARRADNLVDQCYALINLGEVAVALNHLKEADALLSDGLALAQQCGDRRAEAAALIIAGWVAMRRNEPREALGRLSRAAQMFYELGDNFDILMAIGRLALVSHQIGDLDRAMFLLSAERALRASFAYGPSQDHDELVALEAELRVSIGRSFEEIRIQTDGLTLDKVIQHINPTVVV